VARIECVRCGFEWVVATQRKPDNYCPSCRARQVQTVDIGGDKCHPWLGRFAADDVTPIWEDGSPVKPGRQTHSSFRYNIGVRYRGVEPKFPDMTLYEEIVFLQYHSKALWLVENVVPYYSPLIEGQKIGRHLYWSNFDLPDLPDPVDNIRGNQIPQLQELHGFDLSPYSLPNKRQVLRNVVSPEIGKQILDVAILYASERGED